MAIITFVTRNNAYYDEFRHSLRSKTRHRFHSQTSHHNDAKQVALKKLESEEVPAELRVKSFSIDNNLGTQTVTVNLVR